MLDPWLPLPITLVTMIASHLIVTNLIVAFFYRLTHHRALTFLAYALIHWPGTVVHEWAHWLMAQLLGLRASLPHLLPELRPEEGQLVLGHLMVERSDPLRNALVGGAPFIAGSALVALVARQGFRLSAPDLAREGLGALGPLLGALPELLQLPNAWIYLYLIFALAGGMLPSPSDREAWPALLLIVAVALGALALTIGLPTPPELLVEGALHLVAWLTLAFVLATLLNLLLALPLFALERLLFVMGR